MGVVTIVSLIVLAVTIVYVGSGGGSPFARKYELKALMSDVNGLKPGAPVRVGGLEVGTVEKVGFDPKGGMVEVTMKVDRKVQPRVTTKSEANLGSLGLLGEKAMDITPSTEGQPIEDGGYITAAAEDPFKGLLTATSESTSEERTCWLTTGSAEPLTATPSAQATTRTAAVLRAAPPTASSARAGCQVIWSRIRVPAYCSAACPDDAHTSTTNSAPRETHSDDSASPSSCGASQMPTSPPSSRPAVAKAPEMKPGQ